MIRIPLEFDVSKLPTPPFDPEDQPPTVCGIDFAGDLVVLAFDGGGGVRPDRMDTALPTVQRRYKGQLAVDWRNGEMRTVRRWDRQPWVEELTAVSDEGRGLFGSMVFGLPWQGSMRQVYGVTDPRGFCVERDRFPGRPVLSVRPTSQADRRNRTEASLVRVRHVTKPAGDFHLLWASEVPPDNGADILYAANRDKLVWIAIKPPGGARIHTAGEIGSPAVVCPVEGTDKFGFKMNKRVTLPNGYPTCVAVSPDGGVVLGYRKRIEFVDDAFQAVRSFEVETPEHIAFSPCGCQLAIVSGIYGYGDHCDNRHGYEQTLRYELVVIDVE